MATDYLTFEPRPNGDLKITPATEPPQRAMTVWTDPLVEQANEVATKLLDDPLLMSRREDASTSHAPRLYRARVLIATGWSTLPPKSPVKR